MKIIFICTSNYDRSPLLEKSFQEKYPQHQFRSAGINKYHTGRKGTRYLTQDDIDWADLIVYAEDVHRRVAGANYELPERHNKASIILNCGQYVRGNIGAEYLCCAEIKLKPLLQ